MLVCVFAWVGASAATFIEPNILELTPSDVRSDYNNLSQDIRTKIENGTITTIQLSATNFTGWQGGLLENGPDNWKEHITTIDLSKAIMTSTTAKNPDAQGDIRANNDWGFANFSKLKEVIWPTEGNITVIPDYAFAKSGLETVRIPGYIKTVCSHAFDADSGDKLLKSIYFDEYDADPKDGVSDVSMTIGYQAFSNTAGLVDVYVLSKGSLHASNMAFPEICTYGQGDITRPLTRLHFPEEKASDYVNQSHQLDQATASNDGLFQAWLVAHYQSAHQVGGSQSGWYEFVSSGSNPPTEDKDWGDVVLRTFSHPTIDYVVPKGAKAYIVNNVSYDANKKQYSLTLKKVNVIPHGTGVILYGGTNYTNKYYDNNNNLVVKRSIEMMAVSFTGSAYTRETSGDYRNLLVSTSVNASGQPTLDTTLPKDDSDNTKRLYVNPYEPYDNSGSIQYRNFYLGWFSNTTSGAKHTDVTDFVGFFRAKPGKIGARKAYLSLPASELGKDNNGNDIASSCGEIIVPPDVSTVTGKDDNGRSVVELSYRVEYTTNSQINDVRIYNDEDMRKAGYWYKGNPLVSIDWEDDWGKRSTTAPSYAKFSGEPIFEELDNGIATLIVPSSMVETVDTEEYYTLQGVKVNNPSKGVYIKNGKKVIIK